VRIHEETREKRWSRKQIEKHDVKKGGISNYVGKHRPIVNFTDSGKKIRVLGLFQGTERWATGKTYQGSRRLPAARD